ncbi:hypothetical protein JCM8547_003438 [Rhodosporidiobolus lusitaniae]
MASPFPQPLEPAPATESPSTSLPSPPPPAPAPDTPAEQGATPSAEPAIAGMDVDDSAPVNGQDEGKQGTPPPPPAAEGEETTKDSQNNTKEGTPPPAQPSPPKRSAEEEEAERAEKKRKLEKVKTESKARGNRMFGVMLGTLKRAKKEVSTVTSTEAGRKRAEMEQKLQEKLGKERREAKEKEEAGREARDLKNEIARTEEEVAVGDAIYRTRHNAKLDLAGFLCTTFTVPPPASSTTDLISPPFLPKLPHAMSLRDPRASRPIYYLPRRLLPSQEDRIEDQIDAVKKALRKDRDAWDDEKKKKMDKVGEMRRKRDERLEESERREREERQKRRREEEEREDRERERREREGSTVERGRREGSSVERGRRELSVVGSAMAVDKAEGRRSRSPEAGERAPLPEKPEDVPMEEERPEALQINGAAAAAVAAVEEELEY